MKKAYFNSQYSYLEYWTAPNRTTLIDCKNIFIARKYISISGIVQELRVI